MKKRKQKRSKTFLGPLETRSQVELRLQAHQKRQLAEALHMGAMKSTKDAEFESRHPREKHKGKVGGQFKGGIIKSKDSKQKGTPKVPASTKGAKAVPPASAGKAQQGPSASGQIEFKASKMMPKHLSFVGESIEGLGPHQERVAKATEIASDWLDKQKFQNEHTNPRVTQMVGAAMIALASNLEDPSILSNIALTNLEGEEDDMSWEDDDWDGEPDEIFGGAAYGDGVLEFNWPDETSSLDDFSEAYGILAHEVLGHGSQDKADQAAWNDHYIEKVSDATGEDHTLESHPELLKWDATGDTHEYFSGVEFVPHEGLPTEYAGSNVTEFRAEHINAYADDPEGYAKEHPDTVKMLNAEGITFIGSFHQLAGAKGGRLDSLKNAGSAFMANYKGQAE